MNLKSVNKCRALPRRLAIHFGHALLLTDLEGRIGRDDEGFYVGRTRFLSRWRFTINGAEPHFISANPIDHHALISHQFAQTPAGAAAGPDHDASDGSEIVTKAINITFVSFVGGGLRQDVHIGNHGLAPATLELAWEMAADYAGQDEAQKGKREQNASVERHWKSNEGSGGELVFRYRHPQLDHGTIIAFSGAAFAERNGTVCCRLTLAPQETLSLAIDITPIFLGERVEPLFCGDGMLRPNAGSSWTRDEWAEGCTQFSAGNEVVQNAWDRAASDLASLQLHEGDGDERFTPAAGIPKYVGLFGRDALMASWQSTLLNGSTLHGTLRQVARWNARDYDDRYDAEPGKVLHQRQFDPLALLGKTPFAHYYGDYSAPALFLIGVATDLAVTGNADLFLSLRDDVLRTLEWMDRDGDRDGDGFYEYSSRAEKGLKNQGWKDSSEAILYPHGGMVADPIAVCEVQALYYAAKQAIALGFGWIGENERAADLLSQAEMLKRRFNEHFWMPEERFFALALDSEKQPVRTIASNAGACLAYGIIDLDKAAAVSERLMASDLFSGWGIRSLSSGHPAYNPFAYHLGSVWPSPNAVIGFGLKRYGFDAALHGLAKGIFDATRIFELDRLPEVFGGAPRDRRHPHPGLYPGACAPQAWSASAVILFVHAMLGIVPLAPLNTLVVDPDLPDWLPEVTLAGLRVGDARVALRFWRDGQGGTRHEVTEATKGLRVHALPPSQNGEPSDRLAAAVRMAIG
ncbi:MAG TPA: glycogen debranching N-terminal domain-containing protein [Pseudolabrys sp.]|nr:glycogen debranching N-terminal domain-containing protein [Pseudolabrys sp.]